MKPVNVQWGTQFNAPPTTAIVASVSELDDLLDRIWATAKEPLLVTLSYDSGEWLTLGIGTMVSVLTAADADGQAYTCCPQPGLEGPTISFNMYGDASEYAAEHHIDAQTARQAARDFVTTGLRPKDLPWEPDW